MKKYSLAIALLCSIWIFTTFISKKIYADEEAIKGCTQILYPEKIAIAPLNRRFWKTDRLLNAASIPFAKIDVNSLNKISNDYQYLFDISFSPEKYVNLSDCNDEIYLYLKGSRMDSIQLYEYGDGQQLVYTGSAGLIYDNINNFRFPAFPIIPADSKIKNRFLLRVTSTTILEINPILMTRNAIAEYEKNENYLSGFFLGFIIFAFLYNFFLRIRLNDKIYTSYLFLMVGSVVNQMCNDGFINYIWPEQIKSILPYSQVIFAVIATYFLFEFIYQFFTSIEKNRYIEISKKYMAVAIVLFLIVSLFKATISLMLLAVMIIIIIVLGISISIYYYSKKYYHVRFILLSMGLYWFFLIINMFRIYGFVSNNWISAHSLAIGTMLEAVLFSLALADRIRLLEQKKLEAEEKTVEYLKETLTAKERLGGYLKELEIARNIQLSLIPPKLPENDSIKCAAFYKAANHVSGDFYNISYSQGCWYFLIVDIMGHGVGAALIASMVKSAAEAALLIEKESDAALKFIQTLIFAKGGGLPFTAALLKIDPEKKEFTLARCGHPPVIKINRYDKNLQMLQPPGRIAGIIPDTNMELQRGCIESSDRFILYTDGLTESTNGSGESFEEIQFYEVIRNICSLDHNEAVLKIEKTWSSFTEQKIPEDDITFLLIDIQGMSSSAE